MTAGAGGALAGLGGGVVLGKPGTNNVEIEKKLIVSEEVAAELDESGDRLAVAQPEDLQHMGINMSDSTWFGVPQYYIHKMSQGEHDAWLHEHIAVNRRFGYDRNRYQNDGVTGEISSRQWKSFFPGGEFY